MITDDSDWLRLVPREKSEASVLIAEGLRDLERGLYVPHQGHCEHGECEH